MRRDLLASFCLDGNDGCNLLRHLLLKGSGREGAWPPLAREETLPPGSRHYNRFGTSISPRAPSSGEIRVGPTGIIRWGNQWLPGKDCEASETIARKTPELQTIAVEPPALSVAHKMVW